MGRKTEARIELGQDYRRHWEEDRSKNRARPGLYKAWGGRQKQEYMGVPAMLSLDYFNLKLG